MTEKELSIIIPSYQKGEWVVKTIEKIKNKFPVAEIIIVNDASTDDTKKIKDIFKNEIVYLENETNRGKGYSLKKGILEARGKYLIFTDADLPYGTEGIKKIYEELKKGQLVAIGERQKFYSDSFYKKAMRPFLYLILKALFGFDYKDTQAGVKGFERKVGQEIMRKTISEGFAIDVEILYLVKILNYRVSAVPVEQENFSPSTFNLKNILCFFKDLFKIKKHHKANHV